jgi:hypothetical protein
MWLSLILPPLLLASLNGLTVSALPKISAVGSKFFTEDGDQFYVKGPFLVSELHIYWLY